MSERDHDRRGHDHGGHGRPDVAAALASRFRIRHLTIQIETDPNSACALAPDEAV
jgi:hypothetical protein